MVNLFTTLISGYALVNSFNDNGVVIDTGIEKLHYKLTAGVFFLSTSLLGLTELFGKNIQCISNRAQSEQEMKAKTQWCFVEGTYTIPGADLNRNISQFKE